jgi:hypothetical protein
MYNIYQYFCTWVLEAYISILHLQTTSSRLRGLNNQILHRCLCNPLNVIGISIELRNLLSVCLDHSCNILPAGEKLDRSHKGQVAAGGMHQIRDLVVCTVWDDLNVDVLARLIVGELDGYFGSGHFRLSIDVTLICQVVGSLMGPGFMLELEYNFEKKRLKEKIGPGTYLYFAFGAHNHHIR